MGAIVDEINQSIAALRSRRSELLAEAERLTDELKEIHLAIEIIDRVAIQEPEPVPGNNGRMVGVRELALQVARKCAIQEPMAGDGLFADALELRPGLKRHSFDNALNRLASPEGGSYLRRMGKRGRYSYQVIKFSAEEPGPEGPTPRERLIKALEEAEEAGGAAMNDLAWAVQDIKVLDELLGTMVAEGVVERIDANREEGQAQVPLYRLAEQGKMLFPDADKAPGSAEAAGEGD